jgi:hypothetical protein
MADHDSYQRRRETFLTLFLAGILLIGLLFAGILLTGGFLLYVLLVVAVGALVAGMHYWLWGRAYAERTADEREELERGERAPEEDGWLDETRRPRHY